jgi:hypothetical protein
MPSDPRAGPRGGGEPFARAAAVRLGIFVEILTLDNDPNDLTFPLPQPISGDDADAADGLPFGVV